MIYFSETRGEENATLESDSESDDGSISVRKSADGVSKDEFQVQTGLINWLIHWLFVWFIELLIDWKYDQRVDRSVKWVAPKSFQMAPKLSQLAPRRPQLDQSLLRGPQGRFPAPSS